MGRPLNVSAAAAGGLNVPHLVAKRDVGGADRQRRGAKRVAQHDAEPSTADAGVHDLSQRLIREMDEGRGAKVCPGAGVTGGGAVGGGAGGLHSLP